MDISSTHVQHTSRIKQKHWWNTQIHRISSICSITQSHLRRHQTSNKMIVNGNWYRILSCLWKLEGWNSMNGSKIIIQYIDRYIRRDALSNAMNEKFMIEHSVTYKLSYGFAFELTIVMYECMYNLLRFIHCFKLYIISSWSEWRKEVVYVGDPAISEPKNLYTYRNIHRKWDTKSHNSELRKFSME